ncbi:zinc-binding protein [Alsobacter soli]|uniref:Zinc-binding protein n=1 Tax=Alsobacter soli TaxID=2109933 RepID=A0A2T1HZP6_9HYPH|nr:putative zinc-binding protein [Alsobacter soli]PSC07050.1 zinc-binding protein [Alsobacter soli]
MARNPDLPLVYSCSGCSSAAQLANAVAVRLDRRGHAEMSCIAGVGGDVRSLVRTAQSGRPIVAIDGCALACVRNCLARQGVTPTVHHELGQVGVRKRYGADFDPADADRVFQLVRDGLPGAAIRAVMEDEPA